MAVACKVGRVGRSTMLRSVCTPRSVTVHAFREPPLPLGAGNQSGSTRLPFASVTPRSSTSPAGYGSDTDFTPLWSAVPSSLPKENVAVDEPGTCQ